MFERPDATGRPDRVAVGSAGRRAELARARELYQWVDIVTAYAINSRSGAAVAWEPYAYAARYDNYSNPWFPVESNEGTTNTQLSSYLQPGCDMVALAQINVPECTEAFLYIQAWDSCSP